MAYLTIVEIIAIHAAVIQRHGGSIGVRDMGALEASVFRPQSGYYSGPLEESAALGESLFINHPFVDGNKRVAFVAMDVHLRLNGWLLKTGAEEAERFIVDSLSNRHLSGSSLLTWLESVAHRLLLPPIA